MQEYTYFHVMAPDNSVNYRIVKKGMRYTSLSALKEAMRLLKLFKTGCYVFWSDVDKIHTAHRPETVPFCFCASTYTGTDGNRYADLAYYDENGQPREIDPTKLLAHFNRG